MFSEVCLQFSDICWYMTPLNTYHDCQGWWRHKQFIHLKSPVTLQQGVFRSWKFVFLKGGCSSNVWYHTLVDHQSTDEPTTFAYLAKLHNVIKGKKKEHPRGGVCCFFIFLLSIRNAHCFAFNTSDFKWFIVYQDMFDLLHDECTKCKSNLLWFDSRTKIWFQNLNYSIKSFAATFN